MRIKHLIAGVAVALAIVPAAAAQNQGNNPGNPNNPQNPGTPPNSNGAVTLDAKPAIVVFSSPITLSGRLSGTRNDAGVTVRLEQDTTRPYGDGYRPAGVTATTANNGRYSITRTPLQNTQYRVVAQASPPVTSPAKLVLVRTRVGFKLSDSTPARGSLVRISGSVFPAHDGRSVLIQKRSPSGRFVTVARTTLRDAGDARSSYSRRVRVRRDGVYRVKLPSDSDHVNGFSRLRTINVGG